MSETDANYGDEIFKCPKADLHLKWTPSLWDKIEEKGKSPTIKLRKEENLYATVKRATELSMLLLGDDADEKLLERMAMNFMKMDDEEISKLFDEFLESSSDGKSSKAEDKSSEAKEFSLSKIILEDKKEVEIFMRCYSDKNTDNDNEFEKEEKATYCVRVDNMKLYWEYASMEQLLENFEKDCCVDIPKGTGEQLKEWWEHFKKMDGYANDFTREHRQVF